MFSLPSKSEHFSAIKYVKNKFMMIYIERKLLEDIYLDSIIDEFYSTKH